VCAQLYLEHEGEGYEGVDVCEVDVDHALLKTTTSQGIHRYLRERGLTQDGLQGAYGNADPSYANDPGQ
jgi:hypothetical protein